MSKLCAIANNKSRFALGTAIFVSAIFRVKGGTNWYYAFDYSGNYPHRSQNIFTYSDLLGRELFPNVVCAYVDGKDIDTRNVRFFYAPVEHFEKELIISE